MQEANSQHRTEARAQRTIAKLGPKTREETRMTMEEHPLAGGNMLSIG